MEEIKCAFCTTGIQNPEDPETWAGLPICDSCIEKKLEEESQDFDIYDEQNGKCKLCGNQMIVWKTVEIHEGIRIAICNDCRETIKNQIINRLKK